MSADQIWTIERAAAVFLVLCFITFLPAGIMFWMRGGTRGLPVPNRAYFVVERSLVMAAVILTALGLVLLVNRLQDSGGYVLAQTGATTYLFAGVLVVAAEALNLNGGNEVSYPLIVVYVVMAFLAQAAMGGALLQAGLLAAWIGWLTVGWNLGWLVLLPLVSRKDIYFPVLHHVMPPVIGIALLLNGS